MTSVAGLWDSEGHPVLCREDGMLVCSGADVQARPVQIARQGGDGPALLAADGAVLRLGSLAHRVLPVWLEHRDEGVFVLRTHKGGQALHVRDGVFELGMVGDSAAIFTLYADPAGCGILYDIPYDLTFDSAGIRTLLESGDKRLLPVLEALLSLVSPAQAREIWTQSPRPPSSDVFHALFRAHGHSVLPAFSNYTAEAFHWQCQHYGWSIGEKTYGVPTVMEAGRGRLTIGRYCSLANPCIILANHNTRSVTSYPFVDLWIEWPGTTLGMTDHHAKDVVIGNDVWIGTQAVILPGSIIGDGAIIGAGAMVRGMVPPYGICTGNPATVVGHRFDEKTVTRLLRLGWWNWPDGKVDRYLHLLLGTDISAFIDKAEAESANTLTQH